MSGAPLSSGKIRGKGVKGKEDYEEKDGRLKGFQIYLHGPWAYGSNAGKSGQADFKEKVLRVVG